MSIKISDYDFEGPYRTEQSLQDRSGIYVVLCSKDESTYAPVDCGESAEVKSRVTNHDRRACWERNCDGTLYFAVYYTPNLQSSGRVEIEGQIRAAYSFPCGKR